MSAPYKEEDSIRLGSNSANSDLKKALESRLRELEDRTKLAIYEMLTQEGRTTKFIEPIYNKARILIGHGMLFIFEKLLGLFGGLS